MTGKRAKNKNFNPIECDNGPRLDALKPKVKERHPELLTNLVAGILIVACIGALVSICLG